MSGRPFSLATQIAEVDLEVKKRREVYPRLIATGKMTAVQMEYKIDCMLAVRAGLVEAQRAAAGDDPIEDGGGARAPPGPAPRLPLEPAERNAFGHSCAVCGASPAPFGYGFPKVTKFYCRDHRPEA
jgi:hypothetical protein